MTRSRFVEDIKRYLDGKVFDVKRADGNSRRLEYKSNGYIFVNRRTEFEGGGQWQAEEERLCGQPKGGDRGCNDVRNSGEVIRYVQK